MNLGRDLKILKQLDINHSTIWKIIYKWKRFQTATRGNHLSKFSPRTDVFSEVFKNSRIS